MYTACDIKTALDNLEEAVTEISWQDERGTCSQERKDAKSQRDEARRVVEQLIGVTEPDNEIIGQLARALNAYSRFQGDHLAKMQAAIIASYTLPGLETPKMLVISTSHISRNTSDGLYHKAVSLMDSDLRPYWPVAFQKGEYGFLLPLIDEDSDRQAWAQHQDLAVIRQLAEHAGCSWVMLDRDADILSNFPTYDW